MSRVLSAVLPAGVRVTLEHDGTRLKTPLPTMQPAPALLEWEGERARALVRLGAPGTKGSLYVVEHHELARHSGWFRKAREDAQKGGES